MGCRGDALASPPVLGHRPGVARIRRHLVAARVTGVKPVLAPPPLDPLLARRETTPSPFAPLAWAAIGALEFCRNGRDQRPLCGSVRGWRCATHPASRPGHRGYSPSRPRTVPPPRTLAEARQSRRTSPGILREGRRRFHYDFKRPLESPALGLQPRQFPLFGRHPPVAHPVGRPLRRCLPPMTQGLLDQPPFLGHPSRRVCIPLFPRLCAPTLLAGFTFAPGRLSV